MKKKSIIAVVSLLMIVAGIYLYSTYTMHGRVLSLYAFGGFYAPISTKISCAHQSDAKVTEKFKLPLAFDEKTKNDLREFWHFSYYRACLFEAGYDFGGRTIAPSSITQTDNGTLYTNNFAKISFNVPADTKILTDNAVDPDMDDYIINSVLQTGDYHVFVQADRSHKDLNTLDELEQNFTGFSTSSAAIVDKKFSTTQAGAAILSAHQADAHFGFISFTPEKLAVTVFGEKLPEELLNMIESNFVFLSN